MRSRYEKSVDADGHDGHRVIELCDTWALSRTAENPRVLTASGRQESAVNTIDGWTKN